MGETPLTLRASAYAKVNLGLEVLGRRPDGFHEIVSVTQTISLHDTIEASVDDALTVEMDPPLVPDEDNLVRRAASLLASTTNRPPAARILVRKRIPLAAGLGGGSSDAATTLRLLDRLWQTQLRWPQITAIAAELGSDVSLFLALGGTCLIRGRGEIVEPLPRAATVWLALACPTYNSPDKTRALYRALDPSDWSDSRVTLALADRLRAGNWLVGADLVNAFDRAAAAVYPGFVELRAALAAAADVPVHLTGAGPSLFALFATRPDAESAAERMRRADVPVFVTRIVEPGRITQRARGVEPPFAGWPGVDYREPDPGCTPR